METTDAPGYQTTALIPRRTRTLLVDACQDCGRTTPWRCWTCTLPTCATCQVSMYALCKVCHAAYRGPINVLQKESDQYITAEFERMFV